MSRALALGALAAAFYAFVSAFGACGTSSSDNPPADAGPDHVTPPDVLADSKDAADAYVLPPWDPFWHKTTPADFEVIPTGPALQVECGERCEVISSVQPDGLISRRPRSNDQWTVFQVSPGRVHAVNRATGVEYLVDDASGWPGGTGAGAGPSVSGKRAFYSVTFDDNRLLVVTDLETGETKPVWTAKKLSPSDGTGTTAFAHPYVFWEYSPPATFYRFNLETGVLRSVSGGGCFVLEGSSTGFATCAGEGWLDLIDFDKGERRALGQSGSAEIFGGISPDGATAVWADLRHPGPSGQQGTYLFPVAGSEVYRYDFASSTEQRLTFDSPASPVLKTMPRVVGETIVWHSFSDAPNPAPADDLAYLGMSTVWFVKNGASARKLRDGPDRLTYAEPTATGVVALWYEPQDAAAPIPRLVHVAWPPDADGGADAAMPDAQ